MPELPLSMAAEVQKNSKTSSNGHMFIEHNSSDIMMLDAALWTMYSHVTILIVGVEGYCPKMCISEFSTLEINIPSKGPKAERL
jgi:hypothetical protein